MTVRKGALTAALIVLVAAAGWLGWCGARSVQQAKLALADLERLQATASPSLESLPALRADVAALEEHLRGARRAARPFLWLAPRLAWLPRVGPDIAAAPALLEMAVQVAVAGREAVDAFAPAVDGLGSSGVSAALPQVLAAVEAAGPRLAAAGEALARAAALRPGIREPLQPRIQGLLVQLDALLPLARLGIEAATVAPELLGAHGARVYLILAQNSHELRATGGFISGVGELHLDGGRITDLRLVDSYAVDDLTQPHPEPPRPLVEQMGAEILLLRDSNWSPDFPEAAEVARALYRQDRRVATNGAIALDLEAVRLLVAALGPLTVPGVDEPVTGENAIAWMQRAWQAPATSEGTVQEAGTTDWYARRKDFMGELVAAALVELQEGADVDLSALARSAVAMLDGRHLQIAVDDPVAARILAQQGWDGGLRPAAGSDFLAVVDSNVGFNKANAAVRQAIDYRVASSDSVLVATLTMTYTHVATGDVERVCDRAPRYGDSYDEMIRRCYWDYLRVYVPDGSQLLDAVGLNERETDRGVRGTALFAGSFVLRPGDQHVVRLTYRLPAGLAAQPYQLLVRKQAGAGAHPLHVELGDCRWDADLGQDRSFTCAQAGEASLQEEVSDS